MNTLINTNESTNIIPVYLDYLKIEATNADSSLGTTLLPSEPIGWQILIGIASPSKESFIGVLSDKEAEKMKERIKSFKKSFADDLARRNKILFGE
ncbi:MAG: hypothetical protein PHH15_01060 [Candidatus Pacebacteria bacterium]|nr:hypothetical protein [Candidatus Paceibacterota bacterium]